MDEHDIGQRCEHLSDPDDCWECYAAEAYAIPEGDAP